MKSKFTQFTSWRWILLPQFQWILLTSLLMWILSISNSNWFNCDKHYLYLYCTCIPFPYYVHFAVTIFVRKLFFFANFNWIIKIHLVHVRVNWCKKKSISHSLSYCTNFVCKTIVNRVLNCGVCASPTSSLNTYTVFHHIWWNFVSACHVEISNFSSTRSHQIWSYFSMNRTSKSMNWRFLLFVFENHRRLKPLNVTL